MCVLMVKRFEMEEKDLEWKLASKVPSISYYIEISKNGTDWECIKGPYDSLPETLQRIESHKYMTKYSRFSGRKEYRYKITKVFAIEHVFEYELNND